MNILITGGAGYIGSHTILELLKTADTVICVDNGCNTYQDDKEKLPESLKRVQAITGEEVVFYYVDICDKKALDEVFKKVRNDFKQLRITRIESQLIKRIIDLDSTKSTVSCTSLRLKPLASHVISRFNITRTTSLERRFCLR